MKRYLITTKDVESDTTTLADSKNSALDLLSLISNSNDDELISVIEVDVYSAQVTLLEPFLNKKFKLDLREKQ